MTIPHSISKRNKVVALTAATVFAVSTGALAYSISTHPSTKSAIKPQETKVDKSSKPAESVSNVPASENTDTVTSEPQTSTQGATNIPVAKNSSETSHSVPTIDDLKAQYGWNNEMSSVIDTYMKYYPDYFNEVHRVNTFKYMYDVAVAALTKQDQEVTPRSTYYQFSTLQRQYGWEQCGVMVGIDWNSYING